MRIRVKREVALFLNRVRPDGVIAVRAKGFCLYPEISDGDRNPEAGVTDFPLCLPKGFCLSI